MKIAFDVKGTIEGPQKSKVLRLLRALQDRGHEVIVWSNSFGFAQDAVRNNGLTCPYQSKTDKWQSEDQSNWIDVAIDDDSQQTWLAAKRFVWVHELSDDFETALSRIENG